MTLAKGKIINTQYQSGLFLVFLKGGDVAHYHKDNVDINSDVVSIDESIKLLENEGYNWYSIKGETRKYVKYTPPTVTFLHLSNVGNKRLIETFEVANE